MSVLIVGGGIGGLAAAVALRKVGITVDVFERAPEIHEVGAALSIFSNAVKALREMGLEEQVLSLGPELWRTRFLSSSGEVLSSTNVESISEECGAASIMVHRAELQQMLLNELDVEQVHTAKECIGVSQDEQSAIVQFADQTEVRGDIVVGADGIRSAVAGSLFGDTGPRYSGYYCYRAVTETPDVPKHEGHWVLLPGIQFAMLPEVRPGETYWGICRNAPLGTASSRAQRDHLELLRTIAAQMPRQYGHMVERTDPSTLLIDEVFDRLPRPRWGRGRVTLLGDAAHPTTPTFGQGACMALEDAVVLADSLRRTDNTGSALRAYEQRRRRRTRMITNLSWRYGKSLQYEHPSLVKWRTRLLRLPFAEWSSRRVLRNCMRFDPPNLSDTASFRSSKE